MGIPRMPPEFLHTVQPDGRGTLVRGDILSTLQSRADWILRRRLGTSALWVQGPIADGVATTANLLEYGEFLLPPIGATDGKIEIDLYVSSYTSGSLAYKAQVYSVEVGASGRTAASQVQTIATPGAAGWFSATVDVSADPAGPSILRLFGEKSAASVQTLQTVCVRTNVGATMLDGGSAPATYQKLAIAHVGGADRPFDAYTLRTLVRAQNQAALRWSQGLASHYFGTGVSAAAGDNVDLHYRIRQGPIRRPITVWLRVRATKDLPASAIGVWVDDNTYAGAAAASTVTDGSTAFAWYSLTVAATAFTANTKHSLDIRLDPADGSTSMLVSDVVIYEGAATETDHLVNSTNRVDTKAERLWRADRPQLRTGRPIVAGYTGQNSLLRRWSDRATQFRNAVFLAQHRLTTHVADHIGQTASTTQAGYASAEALFRTKHRGTRGASHVSIYALARRVGFADSERMAKFTLYKDAAETKATVSLHEETPDSTPVAQRRWSYLGEVAVTAGTVHDLEIRAGFVDRNGVSTSGNGDFARLDGCLIFEVPRADPLGSHYHYKVDTYSPGTAIPDNDIVTGVSKTIAITASFTIRLLRVYVKVTHAAPTQLRYKLSDGTVTANFRATAHAGDTDTWWSDSSGGITGDATPDAVLSGFIGRTSAATWTLTVYDDTAGTTGTIDNFGLELW